MKSGKEKKDIIRLDLQEIYQANIEWEILEGKSILITGAYGMLATYMMYMLMFLVEEKGMNIKILAIVKSQEKFEKRFGCLKKYPYISVYENSLDAEIEIVEDIDYIIHAASLASPQHYAIRPVEVLLPNVIGNYYLLELAKKKNVSGYLLFSTGDIYGVIENQLEITEEMCGTMDTLDIHNCYSESKRMAETMCNAWFRQKKVPVKIARIWHTYGPTMDIENDPRVFASFVNDIVNGRNILMKSDGKAKRSFCYLADATAAFFLILLSGKEGEAYNVCNTKEFYSIKELADILVKLKPEKNLEVISVKREKKEEYVENSVANSIPPSNKKLTKLGWQVNTDVKEGFRKTIDCIEREKNDKRI